MGEDLALPYMPVDRSPRTVQLPEHPVEQAREAVVFLAGPPRRLTRAGLIRAALRLDLKPLCHIRNPGEPFLQRTADPTPGESVP